MTQQGAGQLALVTGGAGGLGAAISLSLANRGYHVAVSYASRREHAERFVQKINTGGGSACAVSLDYASRDSIRQALSDLQSWSNRGVDVLVNNGAIAQEKPFESITDEDWQHMLQVNLQGPFAAAQEVIPHMLDAGRGYIINVSSIGGQWGGLNQVHYAAAKAGLISLTRSLAKLYAAHGVVSSALAIGLAETEMSARELGSDAGKQKVAGIPAGRLAEPPEIGNAVAYLCSGEADYLCGQTLNFNGGMLFH